MIKITHTKATGIINEFNQDYGNLFTFLLSTGSWRRREPMVKDIDFVVMGNISAIKQALKPLIISEGRRIITLKYKGITVELYFCFDVLELGAMAEHTTGPKGHNIGMRVKAAKMGYLLNQYGLWNSLTHERIDDGTESDIYHKLNMEYKHPEERGRR